MNARFSSMLPNDSAVAARRRYGDFGAPLPLVVVVVVSDIDSLTKYFVSDLAEDYRCWLDWPGRPNCGRAARVRSSPSDLAPRFPFRPSAWQRWLRWIGSCRGGNRRTGRLVKTRWGHRFPWIMQRTPNALRHAGPTA